MNKKYSRLLPRAAGLALLFGSLCVLAPHAHAADEVDADGAAKTEMPKSDGVADAQSADAPVAKSVEPKTPVLAAPPARDTSVEKIATPQPPEFPKNIVLKKSVGIFDSVASEKPKAVVPAKGNLVLMSTIEGGYVAQATVDGNSVFGVVKKADLPKPE